MPSFGLFRKQKNQNNPTITEASISKEEPAGTAVQVVESVQELKAEQLTVAVKEDVLATESVSVERESVSDESLCVESSVEDKVADQISEKTSAAVVGGRLYLKAIPLRDTLDLEGIKAEVEDGNILILRITPLASKSIEAVKCAINELYMFVESIGGDIARLGEERVVVCPKDVRIWREKAPFRNSEALSSSLSSTVA